MKIEKSWQTAVLKVWNTKEIYSLWRGTEGVEARCYERTCRLRNRAADVWLHKSGLDIGLDFIFIVLNSIFLFIYCCSVTVVPPFSPVLTTAPIPPLPQSIPVPIVCAQEYFIHVLWLAFPPSFLCYPPPSSLLDVISLFFISKSLVLFCSFVCFID